MQKFKAFWRYIFLPRPRILLIFVSSSVLFLLPIPFFDHALFHAAAIFFAFYVLLSLSLRLPQLLRLGKRALLPRRQKQSRAEWLAHISLLCGLLLNLSYAILRIFSGIRTRSLWFCAEAVYYMALGAIRFSLVEEARQRDFTQPHIARRSYRRGGQWLLLLSLSAIGIVALAIRESHVYSYPNFIVIAAAMFTLWRVGSAIYHVLHFRRQSLPVPLLSKVISLSAALVSCFGLHGTLLARFGRWEQMHSLQNGIFGALICISLTVMALTVLRKGRQAEPHAPKSKTMPPN